jgi:peptidoglycan/LPS O-acetylase OafA/YrhL
MPKKIPSLDGLRAAAILCVIASHWGWRYSSAAPLGHFGVTAFFVISGYLITELMLRERARTGDVSIKRFYQRRALRIFPAYAMYLLVIAGLAIAHVYRINARSWLGALTYTSCFMMTSMAWALAHTWSLSVEEHFYLIWPVLFRWLRPRTAIGLLSIVVLVSPALRHYTQQWFDFSYSSPSQMSSIAAGCLLSFVLGWGLRPSWTWGIGAVGIFALSFTGPEAFWDTERAVGFALLMALILSLSPRNPIYRMLNCALLVQIGVLSYSLYLWQQPLTDKRMPMWLGAPLLGIIAFVSYRFIESPFLRLKDRLEGRVAAGTQPPWFGRWGTAKEI